MYKLISKSFFILLISCTSEGDKFIGEWESSSGGKVIIKKAGEGYLIRQTGLILGRAVKGDNWYHCNYSNGCFNIDKLTPLICNSKEGIIAVSNGKIFKK